MDNINLLIAYLEAIARYAKDIHYSCKGPDFYGKHLFVDRIYNGLDEFIDGIKEICFLGNDILPLPSGEYMTRAKNLLPAVEPDALVLMQKMLQEKDTPRAEVSLIDGIAQDLQGKLGLVNRQVK